MSGFPILLSMVPETELMYDTMFIEKSMYRTIRMFFIALNACAALFALPSPFVYALLSFRSFYT